MGKCRLFSLWLALKVLPACAYEGAPLMTLLHSYVLWIVCGVRSEKENYCLCLKGLACFSFTKTKWGVFWAPLLPNPAVSEDLHFPIFLLIIISLNAYNAKNERRCRKHISYQISPLLVENVLRALENLQHFFVVLLINKGFIEWLSAQSFGPLYSTQIVNYSLLYTQWNLWLPLAF